MLALKKPKCKKGIFPTVGCFFQWTNDMKMGKVSRRVREKARLAFICSGKMTYFIRLARIPLSLLRSLSLLRG
jgi:hypothetical protein